MTIAQTRLLDDQQVLLRACAHMAFCSTAADMCRTLLRRSADAMCRMRVANSSRPTVSLESASDAAQQVAASCTILEICADMSVSSMLVHILCVVTGRKHFVQPSPSMNFWTMASVRSTFLLRNAAATSLAVKCPIQGGQICKHNSNRAIAALSGEGARLCTHRPDRCRTS